MANSFGRMDNTIIDEADIWKDDILNRRAIYEYLNELLQNSTSPYVFAIDSPWGTGKSFFIERFAKSVKATNPVVLFNAWQNDFSDDYFYSFFSEIHSQLQNADDLKVDIQTRLKTLAKLGGNVFIKSIPIALKAGAKYALGDDGIEAINDIMKPEDEKELVNKIGKLSEEAIKNHLNKKKSIAEFQAILKETVEDIVRANTNLKKPLFVFLDELDRCQPIYAVKLLEAIKHIFSTEGVVFVIAIDRKQFTNSVKMLYGDQTDSHAYLARFIDQTYKLPNPSYANFMQLLLARMPLVNIKYDTIRVGIHDEPNFIACFAHYAAVFEVSLRELEQLYSRTRAIILTAKKKIHLNFLIFLIFVDLKYPQDFDNLLKEVISFPDFHKKIEKAARFRYDLSPHLANVAIYFLGLESRDNLVKRVQGFHTMASLTPEQGITRRNLQEILQDFQILLDHLKYVKLASPIE